MKDKFCSVLEQGRVRTGAWASQPGSRYGAFILQCPQTGGTLRAIGVANALGWDHVSVSLNDRCPTWDEMSWVKGLFFGDGECAVQFHTTEAERINLHPFCLHLWRRVDKDFPMPPQECV